MEQGLDWPPLFSPHHEKIGSAASCSQRIRGWCGNDRNGSAFILSRENCTAA